MDTYTAVHAVRKLVREYGLIDWSVQLDRAKKRAGLCQHGKRIISLSQYFVTMNGWDKVRQTALHEIAHALVGPGHGHDHVWRAKARELGHSGDRCYDSASEVSMPKGKYVYQCQRCGKLFHMHKVLKHEDRRYHGGRCRGQVTRTR